MRTITKSELRELAAHGEGIVLVDRHGRGDERPSTLHRVTCSWPRQTSSQTLLRYEASFGNAFEWLTTHRGPEGEAWMRCADCWAGIGRSAPTDNLARSSAHHPTADVRSTRAVGQPVWTTDRERDLAWVTAVSTTAMKVAGFDSGRNAKVDERNIEPSKTSAFLPRAGDRCYFEHRGEWIAGTCRDDAVDVHQSISVSHDGRQLQLPLTELRFRRLAALAEPVAELGDRRAGSVSRYRARARYVESYWRLAEPSRGLLGVSSAAVDLHPHQVGVARRVLADPVQRYLLADEVGLGKTIEAGLVIRQRLIDAPRSTVLVLVPEALVWQWEVELEAKLGVWDLRRQGVEVVGFDAPRALNPVLTPDLLVIDEAHRVAAGWNSPARELAERFDAARVLAHRVPRILLLSATPVLHREADLLAMLHLLDPDTYRLEDLDSFRVRVEDRERFGELLLALRPGVPPFLLRSRLPDLHEAFPNDVRMAELVRRVASEIDGDSDARETAVADARAHISETYRLHRRLLRNRRSSIEDTSYAVRGRLGVQVLVDGDPRRKAVDEWLERWRVTLLEDAHDSGDQDGIAKAADAFLVYVSNASGNLRVLRDLAQFKLTWKRAYRDAVGLAADEAAAVRAFAITDRQRAVLGELLELLEESTPDNDADVSAIARAILALDQDAILIFASSEATAEALRLEITTAGAAAVSYTAGLSSAQRRMFATAFVEGSGRRFLICDRTGEEGVNLQVADCIVHVDLPLNTGRIEQRIGRVDRHGERDPVTNYVLDPGPDGGFVDWWLQALIDSFGVFNATTSSVQYAIEPVQRALLATLAHEGVAGAAAALVSVKPRVQEEQARIDKLDSLDALARQDTDDVQFVERVLSVEASCAGEFSSAFLHALRAVASDVGAEIGCRDAGGRTIRLSAQPPALRTYLGVSGREILTTADRRLAVTDPDLTLLRPGAPLAEVLRLHQEWDDRCQTAAAWIQDDRYDEPLIAVRCDVVVRADPDPAFAAWKRLEAARPRTAKTTRSDADAPLATAAMQRRLDAYFAPRAVSLWVDHRGTVIDASERVAMLDECLADAEDQRWDDRHWHAVAQSCGALSMDDVLIPVGPVVEGIVLADDSIRETALQAVAHARADLEDAERTLRLRAELNLDSSSAANDLAGESDVAEHLLEALESPAVQWSGAALMFLTTEPAF